MLNYAKTLRKRLDAAGLQKTRIIGPDAFTNAAETLAQARTVHACPPTNLQPLDPTTKRSRNFSVNQFTQAVLDDPDVRAAIGAIGIHGAIPANPSDKDTCTSAVCRTQLPRFCSEDGSTYGDAAGALLRVMQCHEEHLARPGQTFGLSQGSNFWNPFGSYYPALPFYGDVLRGR